MIIHVACTSKAAELVISMVARGNPLASSPGPLSQLFNVAHKKARGGPGTRGHARDAKGRFEVESI